MSFIQLTVFLYCNSFEYEQYLLTVLGSTGHYVECNRLYKFHWSAYPSQLFGTVCKLLQLIILPQFLQLEVSLDALLLLSKLEYAMGDYEGALSRLAAAGLDQLTEKALPTRSLRIVAESYAIKGRILCFCVSNHNKCTCDWATLNWIKFYYCISNNLFRLSILWVRLMLYKTSYFLYIKTTLFQS